MQSFTSGHITSEEGAALIAAVNEAAFDPGIEFHPGVSYRHLAIFANPTIGSDALVATECTPPHNISDQPYAPSLPQGPAGEFLSDLMARSEAVLAEHPVNKARLKQGKLPATSIWLWGQGCAPSMDTYQERFGITGAVVSAVDLVQGIGRCAGMRVLKVPGATGYLDTNYEGKVNAALTALDEVDFVYLHVEAPDEASHEGRTDLKVQAIEDFDRKVVAPCLAYAQGRGDCRVLIAADHVTAISTKTHAGGPVPFALCGADVAANGAAGYSERYADATGVQVREGHALVPAMLQCAKLGAHSL
jgi:2,3-bisphosphoglycerate-independent phosphoglycerate mutase